MLNLILQLNEKTLNEYRFKDEKSIMIGRRSDNDVVINNLGVSSQHAKIEQGSSGFIFTDLNSTNGSFVNQKAVTSKTLEDGDVITIGKHSLLFSAETEEDENNAEEPLTMDRTMVMDTDQYKSLLAKKKSENILFMDVPSGAGAMLTYLSGGEGEVILSKKIVTLGSGPGCDVIVNGLFVSKTAATISKRTNGYFLSFAGGWIKPKVNGKVIKEVALLKEFDIISIGPAKLQFSIR